MDQKRVQVIVELDLDEDVITGRIVDRDGAKRSFYGWMRLIALLEKIRSGAGESAPITADAEASEAQLGAGGGGNIAARLSARCPWPIPGRGR